MKTLIHDHFYALIDKDGISFGIYMGKFGHLYTFYPTDFVDGGDNLAGSYAEDEVACLNLFYLGDLLPHRTRWDALEALKQHRK